MANKQTDPVQILANDIVDTINQVATRRSDKASFDKSYSTTILGVNQNFVMDVPVADQTALVSKYSIPSEVEDGDSNYYIIKLNGVYYCLRQNGDFMLYEKVMAYVPNGDWANIYIDRFGVTPGDGGSEEVIVVNNNDPLRKVIFSSEIYEPTISYLRIFYYVHTTDEEIADYDDITQSNLVGFYVNVNGSNPYLWVKKKCTVTEYEPAIGEVGDYYIKITENGNELYECTKSNPCTWERINNPKFLTIFGTHIPFNCGDLLIKTDNDEDQNIEAVYEYKYESNEYLWELKGNISSGGTQHGVGEWLDAAHTIENFNIYENVDSWIYKNTSNNSYDHLEGFSNTADGNSTGANHLEGAHNTLHGGYYNHIEGQSNTVYSGIVYSAVGGGSNTVGETNGSWQYAIDVKGYHNTVKSSNNTAVRGAYNTVNNSPNSFAAGDNNTLNNASYSMCGGTGNQLSAYYTFAVGTGNTVSASGSAAIGNGNTVTTNEALAVGHGAIASGDITLAIGNGMSGNAVTMSHNGTVTARVYNTTNADYAEYCEWADGNTKNEDRMGLLVEFVGDKIVPAQGFDFIGAISARASVIGNAYENYWHKKYVTDVFGRMMFDDDGKPLINPDFDENQVYIPRSQRPEWAATGLTGRIIVCDNGHCEPGCHVSARRGIACPTLSITRGLCLKRIDDNHIEILIK